MFARGSAGAVTSVLAVAGISWRIPRAPAVDRACGFIRDSSQAIAASSGSGSRVSRAAVRKAPAYAAGTPHVRDTVRAGFAAVDLAGAFATTGDLAVARDSDATARTSAPMTRRRSGQRRFDSTCRTAARRRDRAKTR